MANQYARLNLASAIFPFYTEAAGRTIMLPGLDENFDRYNAANTAPDKGVPQVFYMHNCFPLSSGFQSIGYTQPIAPFVGANDFDTCFSLIGAVQKTNLFSPAAGKNYFFDGNVGHWVSVSPLAPGTVPANVLVTTAYVQGVTYIYYANLGCFTYDDTTRLMVPVTLTGLTATAVLGIFESQGYLVAYTATDIAWSSLTQATDFIPSIQTGAGGGTIAEAKGFIKFGAKCGSGWILYCQKNSVGGSYTANPGFPFIIKEVPGAGGINNGDCVAFQSNIPYHTVLTTSGIQQVTVDGAISTMPEVSDFVTAQIFEDFDEVGLTFSSSYLAGQVATKFAFVGSRFIVISYGIVAPDYTHAIIFDIELNRYGKVKLPHRCCFSFSTPTPSGGDVTFEELMNTPINTLGDTTYQDFFLSGVSATITPKENIAFLQQDGTVQLVDFSVGEAVANGVFIIGKFQFARGNVIVHQRTDVESVNRGGSFSMFLLPTFNGKDFAPAVPTVVNNEGQLTRTLAKRYTASNISLCLLGAFNATSMVMNFTIGGSR